MPKVINKLSRSRNSSSNNSFSKKPRVGRDIYMPEKLNKSDLKELIEKLEFYYGVDLNELNSYYFYLNSNTGKVYLSTNNLSTLEITRFAGVGIYFGVFHDGGRFRLSLEGSKFINPKINFVEIEKDNLNLYLSAKNLDVSDSIKILSNGNCPFLIVKFENESLGCISIKEDVLLNYMSKSRKLELEKLF